MNACPICGAAWPQGASALHHAVCSTCFSVFQRHQGHWQHVPPGWRPATSIPFPLGTPLRLRSTEYRVAGFAGYNYHEEFSRDQWETYERHEYTLTDLTGANPRLLCWTSHNWFLARPVDPSMVTARSWTEAEFEARKYLMQQPRTYTSDHACGYLTHPFRWREIVSIADSVSDRFVIAAEFPGREYRWVGEQLEPRELLTALALPEFPPAYRTAVASPPALVSSPPSAVPASTSKSNSISRWLAVLLLVLGIFGAIGTVAYRYEQRTKPVATRWFQCELKPVTERIDIPKGATRAQLDPHFPMGALNYRIRILDLQAGELETRTDFLDMNPARRTVEVKLPERAALIEVTCNLSVKVQGMTSWPVELRFLR